MRSIELIKTLFTQKERELIYSDATTQKAQMLRHKMIYLMRKVGLTQRQVSEELGYKGRSSVSHICRKIKAFMELYPDYKNGLEEKEKEFNRISELF